VEKTMARVAQRVRAERLQIMLDGEELVAVDDFRFKRRMPSRASAVRELLKRGLAAEGFLSAAAGVKSTDYGVIGKTPTNNPANDPLYGSSDSQSRGRIARTSERGRALPTQCR
jgi:hypothetical protein